MTQDVTTHIDPARIAVIAAAVQAYLAGETRDSQSESPILSGWRGVTLPVGDDVFAVRRRTWTGRDQA